MRWTADTAMYSSNVENISPTSQEESQKAFRVSTQPAAAKVLLDSPTAMPNACGYLWNKDMLIQMNCRGYAVAQFMQPEPSKYSQGPYLEAKTFIQPEHTYFSHHPGRFFYIKDEDDNQLFSIPYEPCRTAFDSYTFEVGLSDIAWTIKNLGFEIYLKLTLPVNGVAEMWQIRVKNVSAQTRNISLYPFFSVGNKSWMNQGACFDEDLNAIVASSITPYQKVEDYYKNSHLKDITFLASNNTPSSWSTHLGLFEGEGGLHRPSQIMMDELPRTDAIYDVPAAIMQFKEQLLSGQEVEHKFIFGAAKDKAELLINKENYFANEESFDEIALNYQRYMNCSKSACVINIADKETEQFINHWLPRQVFYHGDVNRLTTDPQTRNLLQDNMGMIYLAPKQAKNSFLIAMSQQQSNGEMPDGILLHPDAELKYINQVPHADHAVWLTICIKAYLDETNDTSILVEQLPFADSTLNADVIEHIELALAHLIKARDHRGLSFIEQGDWCDPMNMVGHKGKGVSSWLSLASAYAIKSWLEIIQCYIPDYSVDKRKHYQMIVDEINLAVNTHLWDGSWYARGITDDNRIFGTENDSEGRIYLNPQSWALLSGAAGIAKKFSMLNEIDKQLNTPYGVMMLAPAYTSMQDDIGRLTQKYPGVAENGSVYNHAAAFYAYSLYQIGENDLAFQVLKKMIPNEVDALVRGQLPNYIPNYYRGAYHQLPQCAGRSSHLFNTGTVAWVYRCVIEELVGLKGRAGKLFINPKLPEQIDRISGIRHFMGAEFEFVISKYTGDAVEVQLGKQRLTANVVNNIESGKKYQLNVRVPSA